MQRRRATSPAAAASSSRRTSDSSGNLSPGMARSVSRSQSGSLSLDEGGKHNNDAKTSTILPLWLVVSICLFFLAAGWLQHHYEESRLRDPLTGRIMHHHGTGSHFVENKNDKRQQLVIHNNAARIASRLTETEDSKLEYDHEDGSTRYHIVFSTDCSAYQHWQSYLVFYTALKVRQPGHVTRIASGCNSTEEAAIKSWFETDLTPKFSQVLDDNGKEIGDYKFKNKPYGLKYYMENSKILNFNGKDFPENVASDVVILIDPDMALLRPITADFSDPRETIIGPKRKKHQIADKVAPGKPFAQVYGFGAQWSRLDLEKIAGKGTPAAEVSFEDGRLYYPAGPPYLATVNDMHAIAVQWSKFVPAVYEQYPHLLAEMFAFSIAAAHLKLPFQLVDSLMVSDVSAPGEGWDFVDKIPAQELCGFCLHEQDHAKYALPSVLHMCQRYIVGEDWFFAKRRVPSDIYDCKTPLFAEPPDDLAVKFGYKQAPGGKRFDMNQVDVKRESFAICYIYALLNEAASFYKLNKCPANNINLSKTRNLVKYLAEQKAIK